MIVKLSRVLVPALLLVVVGCSSTSTQEVKRPDLEKAIQHPEMCRLYLFRKTQPFGSTNMLEVYDGDTRVGVIAKKAFLCWERLPGPVKLRMVLVRVGMQDLQGIQVINTQPGKTYYLQVHTDDINRRPKISELTELSAEETLIYREPAELP